MRFVLCVLCIGLAASAARAGGLVLPEPDPGALGRAGTGAAIPTGPSAVYHNPAGIALGQGLSIEAGVTADVDRTVITVNGAGRYPTMTTSAMPSIFVSQRLGDHFAAGLGLFGAPSQTLDYPEAFPGRFRILRASFGGAELDPVVAGRPFSWLAIGFGLRVVFGDLDLARALGDGRYETRLGMRGSVTGIGGSGGVWARLYKDYLTLGAVYKSAIDLDHSGRATTTLPGSDTPLAVDDLRLTLPLPHLFTFALGSRPRPGTSIELLTRVGLLRDLDALHAVSAGDKSKVISDTPLDLHELVQVRVGFEQRLLRDHAAVRLGIGYDLGAGRHDLDPALPDGDRVIVSAGIGYVRKDFWIDAGYLAAISPGGTASQGTTYAADYAQVHHRFGVSLSIRAESVGPRAKTLD